MHLNFQGVCKSNTITLWTTFQVACRHCSAWYWPLQPPFEGKFSLSIRAWKSIQTCAPAVSESFVSLLIFIFNWKIYRVNLGAGGKKMPFSAFSHATANLWQIRVSSCFWSTKKADQLDRFPASLAGPWASEGWDPDYVSASFSWLLIQRFTDFFLVLLSSAFGSI